MIRKFAGFAIGMVQLIAGAVALWPAQALASTYGSASYNSNTYNGTLHIGPITLPDTGSAVLLAAGVASVVAGMAAWLWAVRQRRRA